MPVAEGASASVEAVEQNMNKKTSDDYSKQKYDKSTKTLQIKS